MKIAMLEASHWHTPLYLDALESPGVQVVAVSDGEQAKGRDIAARFGCPIYESYEELLQQETIDFAFAFGRHAEMPRIAEMLIERRIPFALEKPCGVKAAQVARLRQLAESAGVYVAVPFIFRISDLLAAIEEMEGRIPIRFQSSPVSLHRWSALSLRCGGSFLDARPCDRWWRRDDQCRHSLFRPVSLHNRQGGIDRLSCHELSNTWR